MLQLEQCREEISLPNDRKLSEEGLSPEELRFLDYIRGKTCGVANFDSEKDLTHELTRRRWWIDPINIPTISDRVVQGEKVVAVYSWDIPEDSVLSYLLIRGSNLDMDILFNKLE
ncbi:MAG: hypothetical protein ABI758_05470 [Candidatus Woesebacteria bacterium]